MYIPAVENRLYFSFKSCKMEKSVQKVFRKTNFFSRGSQILTGPCPGDFPFFTPNKDTLYAQQKG